MAKRTAEVGVLMGSQSDWETMRHCVEGLEELGVAVETFVISAHRTPDSLIEYARGARERGLKVMVAGAGGAAHLPGMCAALTDLPVIGIPMEGGALKGLDAFLAIAQMPAGVPVGTTARGVKGAVNAAAAAGSMARVGDAGWGERLKAWRAGKR